MISIMKNIGQVFKRRLSGDHKAIIGSIDNSLNTLKTDVSLLELQYLIGSSTGMWLDEWGSWFGIARIMNESDESYRNRILAVSSTPKNTIPSIQNAIKLYMGDDTAPVEVYEPYTNVRRFNISTFSGPDKYQDGTYYRSGVIDVRIPVVVTDIMRTTVQQIKSAGVKVYFSQITQLNSPTSPTNPFGVVQVLPVYNPWMDYHRYTDILNSDVRGPEFSGYNRNYGRSGWQVIFNLYISLQELPLLPEPMVVSDKHTWDLWTHYEWLIPLLSDQVLFQQWRYIDLEKSILNSPTGNVWDLTVRHVNITNSETQKIIFTDITRAVQMQSVATATKSYTGYVSQIQILQSKDPAVIYNDTRRRTDVPSVLGAKVMNAGSNELINNILYKTIDDLSSKADDGQSPVESVTSPA